jgi:outer membrane protein assembly factor BamD (BamD/ComL family)
MKLTLFLIHIFLIVFSYAQDVKRGLKQLERENLKKAEQTFFEIKQSNPEDPIANYGLARIYAHPEFENKNLYKAYEYILLANENTGNISEENLADINGLFTTDSISFQRQIIDDKLYDEVASTRKIDKLNEFIKKCPQSFHFQDAVAKRNQLEFWNAKYQNTVFAYEQFIQKHPYADDVPEAKKLRNEIAWSEVRQKHTIEAYNDFISQYPDAIQTPEAIKERDNLEYQKVKLKSTLEAYQEFIDKYPDSEFIFDARRYRNAYAYRKASIIHTIESYNHFIDTYPDAKQIPDAIAARNNLILQKINTASTKNEFNELLMTFGSDKELYQTMMNKKSVLLGNKMMQYNKFSENSFDSVLVFDKSGNTEKIADVITNHFHETIIAANIKQEDSWHHDIWLMKLNVDGKLIWDKKIGHEYDDVVHSAAVLPDNSILLAGHFDQEHVVGKNIRIIKLDTEGETIWERTFEGTDAIAVNYTGIDLPIITGYTMNTDGTVDAFLLQLNANGDLISRKTFPEKTFPVSVFSMENGDIYVAGKTWLIWCDEQGNTKKELSLPEGYKIFDASPGVFNRIYIAGYYYDFTEETRRDIWTAVYTYDLEKKWDTILDDNKGYEHANSISVSLDGRIWVSAITSVNHDKEDDCWFLVFDSKGNKLKEFRYGTEQNEKNPVSHINNLNTVITAFHRGLNSDIIVTGTKLE